MPAALPVVPTGLAPSQVFARPRGPMSLDFFYVQLPRGLSRPGALRRAAYTEDRSVLFVNAGIDPSRPLEAQKDSFWWSGGSFAAITKPYGTFRRVVRGFDPSHAGYAVTDYTATLDGGCGFGGSLVAACLTPEGEILEVVEG